MGRKIIDLTGKKYSMLSVISRSGESLPIKWDCLCDCGNTTTVVGDDLKNGSTKSCGCFRKVKVTTHGESKTRLYKIWTGIKSRCYNQNFTHYNEYGARGISVCQEWFEFEKFRTWAIESGYSDSLEIDRKDVNGNYEPSNCRWVNSYEQAYNKRVYRNNSCGVTGVNFDKRGNKWQSRISVEGKRITLGSFESFDDAVKARQEAEIKYYGGLKHE